MKTCISLKIIKKTTLLIITYTILTGFLSCKDRNIMIANENEINMALCQIFCLDGDRAGNFVRIENALEEAKKLGAEIACFPETSIYGWVNPIAHEKADSIPGRDSEKLCQLAKKYGLYISIGLAEKNGQHLHDAAILIDDRGEILIKHRKFNILSELMTPPYTPGDGNVSVTDTKFGKIAMLICADSFVKEHIDKLAKKRPDLVLVPYGWVAKKKDWPEHGKELEKIVSQVARKTRATVVGTDLVGQISNGPWTGQVYGGQSVVVDAAGKVLARAKDRDRDIKLVRVPKKHVSAPTLTPEHAKFLKGDTLQVVMGVYHGEIRFTLDGSEPTMESERYSKPVMITNTTGIKACAFENDKKSLVVSGHYEQFRNFYPSRKVKNPKEGLRYKYYEGKWRKLPDFGYLEVVESGITRNIDLSLKKRENHVGFVFDGYINIPVDGLYTFYLKSDDGSKLFIDGELVIDNDGCHGAWEIKGQIPLEKGFHGIQVQYFDDELYEFLSLAYEGKGIKKQPIPDNVLFHN